MTDLPSKIIKINDYVLYRLYDGESQRCYRLMSMLPLQKIMVDGRSLTFLNTIDNLETLMTSIRDDLSSQFIVSD